MAVDPDLNRSRSRFPWLQFNVVACAVWIAVPCFKKALEPDGCIENLRLAGDACTVYAIDADDRLPLATSWMDATLPYAGRKSVFACPDLDDPRPHRYGHAFNGAASGVNAFVTELSGMPLLFDSSDLRWNAHGDMSLLPRKSRHSGGHGVFYWEMDSSAARVESAHAER